MNPDGINFQGCRGYGYPWIYPWTFLFILIQMTDITILINVISSCHRMGWLNTRLKYNDGPLQFLEVQ